VKFLTRSIVSFLLLKILYFRLFLLFVVIIEIFSGLVKTFEEVHHISQSDINLEFIDVFENFSCLDLAIDVESYFRAIEAQALFVQLHYLWSSCLICKYVEQLFVVNFCNPHY